VKLQPRERRALMLLPVGLVVWVILYFVTAQREPDVVAPTASTVAAAEKRLTRLREIAASVPAKEEILKKVSADLAEREKGLIRADTGAQAQAQLVQILRRLAAAENPPLDFRATELGGISPLGDSYGAASVTVQLECRVDQLVNFLASIGAQNELLSTGDIRVNSTSPKEKTVIARLTVTGVVPRKLVVEKKGAGL
jgi:Type II secretion system (T2SS), protein M subtype b